jgi:hypothetical protein
MGDSGGGVRMKERRGNGRGESIKEKKVEKER